MQAVILAGGLGTRLRPVTAQLPKVMVPVNGKPFLSYLLEMLAGQGITDVVLCTGYRGEQVRDYFGDGQRLGLKLSYSREEGRLLGTGGALKQAQPRLEERFLVLNGDTYLPIDYTDIEEAFLKRGKKALTVVYDNRENTGVGNNIEVDQEMMVIRYDKQARGAGYVEAGVLALERGALDLLASGQTVSLEVGLYPTLIARRELAACVTGQRFYDIGSPEKLNDFTQFIRRRQA